VLLGSLFGFVRADLGFALATVLALAGTFVAFVALLVPTPGVVKPLGKLLLVLLGNGFMTFLGAAATFLSIAEFTRGRQLRRFGRLLLPSLQTDASWAKEQPAITMTDSERAQVAHQWRENGRTEHASVAAFARLTLDLLALGAPPALVASAQRDALDEIRHSELCFSLARAIDGVATSPAPFTAVRDVRVIGGSRSVALARLAVDSLVDGALHEGVSARVLAQLTKRTPLPAIRALLKELSADEGRHAAHGWDVVRWCVDEGGQPVIDALHGAIQTLPETMLSPLPTAAGQGLWERYGIHSHALEAAEYQKARADIVRRVRAFDMRAAA
jgi:hypothetical protein